MRKQVGELPTAFTRRLLDPRCDTPVSDASFTPRQRPVRDVARKDVLEDVLTVAGNRRAQARHDQLPVFEGAQGVVERIGVAVQKARYRPGPENSADDRRRLQRALLPCVE